MALAVSCSNILRKQDELLLLGQDFAIQMLLEFMHIVANTALFKENDRSVETAILDLAHLDAFIATSLTCLREDGSHSVGDGRWKLYLDTFTTFLPLA